MATMGNIAGGMRGAGANGSGMPMGGNQSNNFLL
jgi:hypothetical protein